MTKKEFGATVVTVSGNSATITIYPALPDIEEVILIDLKGEEQKCVNLRKKPWRTDTGAVAKLEDVTNAIFITKLGGKQYYKIRENDLRMRVLHRVDGPALEYANGYLAHYIDGEKHGAVIFAGNICSIWDKGIRILPEQKENNEPN